MIILAIDPGTNESGYIIWDSTQKEIRQLGIISNSVMLDEIIMSTFDVCAIEYIQAMGMNVGQTVFDTCLWAGRFWQLAGDSKTVWIPRRSVKLWLCQSPRAKDSNIRQALIDRFGKPGTKKNPGKLYGVKKHIWSALAIAVTYAEEKEGIKLC